MSHRLLFDVTFLSPGSTRLRSLLPIFHFVEGLERRPMPLKENPHFKEYRRSVLRGRNSDDFWIMAERIWRTYTC